MLERVSRLVSVVADLSEALDTPEPPGGDARLLQNVLAISSELEFLFTADSPASQQLTPIVAGLQASVERGSRDEAQSYVLPLVAWLRSIEQELSARRY